MKKFILSFLVFVILFVSKIEFISVTGTSMEPTLHQDDILIVYQLDPEVGDIVIIDSTGICDEELIVKRVSDIKGDLIFVEGDNKPVSNDSRYFGWIDKNLVVGVVLYHFPGIPPR